jgi:hypothetical protein
MSAPDGRSIVLTACPHDGRRILRVDVESGAVVDLSQPRWDAWAAVEPLSGDLVLTNGRGGLWRWRVPLEP